MTEEEHRERVREIAQQLYEQEGRPAGRAYEHWKQAERTALMGGGQEPPTEGSGEDSRV